MYWKYFIAWFPMFVIALANATIREVGYKRDVGELAAHQISTLTACILVGVYVWVLSNYLGIQSAGQAIGIGLMWLIMTVAFEFGFGHFIVGDPWSRLLHDYNVLHGRVWSLFVLWIAVAPYVFYEIKSWRWIRTLSSVTLRSPLSWRAGFHPRHHLVQRATHPVKPLQPPRRTTLFVGAR